MYKTMHSAKKDQFFSLFQYWSWGAGGVQWSLLPLGAVVAFQSGWDTSPEGVSAGQVSFLQLRNNLALKTSLLP